VDRGFDYIIVGGGTAGCVLANRLSANPRNNVLLIESGIDTPPDRIPADILDPYPLSYGNPLYRWQLKGHALTRESSPAAPLLQGRVLGGGSSIMGMIMLRGLPIDYDGWAARGASGWAWKDVLPFFNRLETDLDFDGPLHGKQGPTEIRRHRREDWPLLAAAAGTYAQRCGIPYVADMNADFADGYGSLPIAGPEARRASSAISYLTRAVRARPNLEVMTDTTVANLLFEGSKVTGVQLMGGGAAMSVRSRETILTMGALLTPAFLLRQGIGDPTQLSAAGIPPRVARPGVGANLQNHASILVLAHLRRIGVQRRPMRNHNNTLFRYSSGLPGCEPSDMALAFGSRATWHGIARRTAHFSPLLMAPSSRGQVVLRRGRKGSAPETTVEFNLLGDQRDQARLIDGLRRVAALTRAPELARLIGTAVGASRLARAMPFERITTYNTLRTSAVGMLLDLVPGLGDAAVGALSSPGEELLNLLSGPSSALEGFVRANVRPVAHHCGTCRMGARNDPLSVVDPEGRVIGVDGLRVADASVMPTVPRGNTNLPTLMVAEKLADAILSRTPA
jgi:5-(hydroxymethyl)furfural/furfural oxidase